jgi:hydrogenase expression/formation protein HypC
MMCLAVPMEVLQIDGDMAEVEHGGVKMTVSLMVCDFPPQVGDYVIVHAGFAIRRVDPQEAQESLKLLTELVAAADSGGEGYS